MPLSGIPPEGHELDNSVASQLAGDIANLYSAIERDKCVAPRPPAKASLLIYRWNLCR